MQTKFKMYHTNSGEASHYIHINASVLPKIFNKPYTVMHPRHMLFLHRKSGKVTILDFHGLDNINRIKFFYGWDNTYSPEHKGDSFYKMDKTTYLGEFTQHEMYTRNVSGRGDY